VQASTKARFEETYRGIADRLDLPRRDNPQVDSLRLVSDWLCDETNGNWVMIIDSADDTEVFYPKTKSTIGESLAPISAPLSAYLPQSCNGSILITSRSKYVAARMAGGYKRIKEVLAMNESQALHLFRSKMQDAENNEGAADLVRALEYIPLAITQAAAFINHRDRMTPANYLDEFQRNDKKRKSLLNWDAGDLRRDERASNSVVSTWQMSFERIVKQRHSAADLLSLMSFFNPQGIPGWMLRSYNRDVAQSVDKEEADSAFENDLDTLLSYSLVKATGEKGIWEMHGLVQFCTQVWLSSFGDAQRWNRSFLALMAKEFPDADFKNWGKCKQLLPHVESLYQREPSGDQPVREWAKVLDHAAWYIHTAQGKYDEAERLHRRALEGREREFGAQHPDTLRGVSNMAVVLQYQGEYDKAEELNRRVLEGWEKDLGAEHPDTLISVSNLALVLRYRGKYEEAEKLSRRALKGKEKKLGANHRETLISLSTLAGVLRDQGKYDESEKLNRRALEMRGKELGAKHPDTLTSVSSLAVVLGHLGKYEEAEKLSRRALKEKEKELGEEHPSTLVNMNNLAGVLCNQGKYAEAEKLSRRVLEETEKQLGADHPDTLTCVYSLAYNLHKQKRYSEASELYQRAYDGYKLKLGPRHPTSIDCFNDLTAMRNETERTAPGQSRTLVDSNMESPGNNPPCSATTLSSEAMSDHVSNQQSQQRSFYRRIRAQIRRKAS
jgi:tetratricopeptide (TPR) repeat protein